MKKDGRVRSSPCSAHFKNGRVRSAPCLFHQRDEPLLMFLTSFFHVFIPEINHSSWNARIKTIPKSGLPVTHVRKRWPLAFSRRARFFDVWRRRGRTLLREGPHEGRTLEENRASILQIARRCGSTDSVRSVRIPSVRFRIVLTGRSG